MKTIAIKDRVRILHLEDDASDAALIARLIERRLRCQITLVSQRTDFEKALSEESFDLILSDFQIPAYSGAEALEFTRVKKPEIPFLFVSGTIGEVAAVDCLKRGATDYILKDAPQRLVPAIERALRDAAERKKQKETEAALAESQHQFRALVEKSPVGIYIIQSHRFVYANPAFSQMLGYSAEELGKLSPDKLIDCHDDDEGPASSGTVSFESMPGIRYEVRLCRRDAKTVIAEIHSQVIRLQGRRAILGAVVDNSDKHKLQAHVERLQRIETIGAVASGIAHDLNNVLTPILVGVEMLRNNGSAAAHDSAMLDVIEKSAQTGATMVQRILTFARGSDAQRAKVNLCQIILDHERIIRKAFPRSIELRIKCPDTLAPVVGNETEILQALMNLCVNARDAMAEGGRIEISAENRTLTPAEARTIPGAAAGKYSVISVTDNGVGIPPEIIDQIFEPFFSTKRVGNGTGLGLSSVAKIARRHSGFVTVSSEVGAGSQFSIYLPHIPEGEDRG